MLLCEQMSLSKKTNSPIAQMSCLTSQVMVLLAQMMMLLVEILSYSGSMKRLIAARTGPKATRIYLKASPFLKALSQPGPKESPSFQEAILLYAEVIEAILLMSMQMNSLVLGV